MTCVCSLYTGSMPDEIKKNILRDYPLSAALFDHFKG